jgi:hypothetical protein
MQRDGAERLREVIDFSRAWEMPNRYTFAMRTVIQLLRCEVRGKWIDPFCGLHSPATVTKTGYHGSVHYRRIALMAVWLIRPIRLVKRYASIGQFKAERQAEWNTGLSARMKLAELCGSAVKRFVLVGIRQGLALIAGLSYGG